MKHIYTIFLLLFFTTGLQAQITISFEEEEGFELGTIHEQNGWEVTELQGMFPIANQVVSDEMASDGTYAFKNAFEPDYDFQVMPIIGAVKIFDTPLDYKNFTISYDILITDVLGANFEFTIYTIIDEEFIPVAGVGMKDDGEIFVIKDQHYNSDLINAVWQPNTWTTIKIEVDELELKYYVENELQHTSNNFTQANIYGMNMLHDNYGHDAYYDKIEITSSTLGVENQVFENTRIYPNPTSDFVTIQLLEGQELKEVHVYNIIGKLIYSKNTTKLDFRSFPAGTYILKVSLTDGQSLMRKIIKI